MIIKVNKEREIYLRERFTNRVSYYLCYTTFDIISEDFIREWKNVINWNEGNKKYLLKSRGEKFYKELFGG